MPRQMKEDNNELQNRIGYNRSDKENKSYRHKGEEERRKLGQEFRMMRSTLVLVLVLVEQEGE